MGAGEDVLWRIAFLHGRGKSKHACVDLEGDWVASFVSGGENRCPMQVGGVLVFQAQKILRAGPLLLLITGWLD